MARQKKIAKPGKTAEYRHQEKTPARPDVGTQPQFKKRAPPKTWRYDSPLPLFIHERLFSAAH